MRVSLKPIVLLSMALACLWLPAVHAYGTATHAKISAQAYLDAHNIQANFFTALAPNDAMSLPQSAMVQALMNGSINEDNDNLVNTNNLSYPQARVLYHFYDPLGPVLPPLPTGGYGLTGGLQFTGPHCVSTTSASWLWGIAGVGEGAGNSLVTTGLNFSSYNQWPWAITDLGNGNGGVTNEHGAQAYFYQGLTSTNINDRATQLEKMFESLGHVIHLLQDAAQPQHVRNDSHLNPGWNLLLRFLCGSNPSAYETYVDNNFQKNPQWFTGYPPPVFASDSLGPFNFFSNIAFFTNNNFVSRGTNCTVPPPPSCSIAMPCPCSSGTSATSSYTLTYPSPEFSGPPVSGLFVNLVYDGNSAACMGDWLGAVGTSEASALCSTVNMTFYQNTFTDPSSGITQTNGRMTSSSIFDPELLARFTPSPHFTLNEYNYASQANVLLPMAEGYSAGVLNYFFRGSMAAAGNSNGFTITNNSMNGTVPENMSGQFTLYYDDVNGNRNAAVNSWSISIPGNGTASADVDGNPLFFTPPEDSDNPAPAAPGQYILVFKGMLGSDVVQAVAGAVVTIPSAVPAGPQPTQLKGRGRAIPAK